MAAVEHRDRKQIDQTEIDREHGHEPHEGDRAALRDLARHLGDTQWTADFVGRPRADDHLPHRSQGASDEIAGFLSGPPNSVDWIAANIVDSLALDPEQREAMVVAETVGD